LLNRRNGNHKERATTVERATIKDDPYTPTVIMGGQSLVVALDFQIIL